MYFHTGRQCTTILAEVSGEAKTHQGGRAGLYNLRQGVTTNSREDWITADGKYAIWYQGGYWNIGDVSDRGTNICGMQTPTTSLQSPVDAGNKWKYYNGKAWVQSDGAVQVTCEGTYP